MSSWVGLFHVNQVSLGYVRNLILKVWGILSHIGGRRVQFYPSVRETSKPGGEGEGERGKEEGERECS